MADRAAYMIPLALYCDYKNCVLRAHYVVCDAQHESRGRFCTKHARLLVRRFVQEEIE